MDCFISPMDLCRVCCGVWLLSNSKNSEGKGRVLRVDAAACPKTAASLVFSEPTSDLKTLHEMRCSGGSNVSLACLRSVMMQGWKARLRANFNQGFLKFLKET